LLSFKRIPIWSDIMDKTALLKDKIADADMVLIGIGEEFSEKFENIADYPTLAKALTATEQNESLAWLVPYLEALYLKEEKTSPQVTAYRNLCELIRGKNYFIVTTCIDGLIHNAGLDDSRIVEPCGNYSRLQCSRKCNSQLYDAESYLAQIQSALEKENYESLECPICDECGAPLSFNHIMCENYAEEGYLPQWQNYTKWLQLTLNRKLCILELGVGMHLPQIIRWRFEKVGFLNQKSTFFRINETLYQLASDMGDKGVSIRGNSMQFLTKLHRTEEFTSVNSSSNKQMKEI